MKRTIQFLLLIFAVATCSFKSQAQQNTYPILSTSVETACILKCFDADTIPMISDSSLVSVKMLIQLFEFTGIESIRVKLGTADGGSELLDKTFAFDVFGNVGNGCTYGRIDDTILLGLGIYNGLTSYFSRVTIEKVDHSCTDFVSYNR